MESKAEHSPYPVGPRRAKYWIKSQLWWYIVMLAPHIILSYFMYMHAYFRYTVLAICLPLIVRYLAINLRVTQNQTEGELKPPKPVVKDVIVVGAGASGLVTIKELKAAGHKVKCFEKMDNIGGIFYRQDGRGGVWDTCRLTSSPFVTAFSDFPPAKDEHTHWGQRDYFEYVQRYVKKFGLLEHITFNSTVHGVREMKDGSWRVHVTNEEGEHDLCCDTVVICSGLNQEPNVPSFPGEDKFKAKGHEIMHSCWYKDTNKFTDKNVLFVGIGETGADLIKQVSAKAKNVYVSVRRGTFVIPRINSHTGLNNDYDTNRLRYSAPIKVRDTLIWLRENFSYYLGQMSRQDLIRFRLSRMSGAGAMSQFACKSDEFVSALAEGRAKMKPPIRQLTEDGAIFSRYNFTRDKLVREESSVKVDVILLCTGFTGKATFVSLKNGEDVGCMSNMYKKMLIPECGTSIAFIGYARPSIGSVPPIAEMQARYLALLLSGKRALPDVDKMHEITRYDKKNHNFKRDGARPTLVNYIQYMDDVASLIGCRPSFMQLVTQPMLLWSVLVGAFNAALYRLSGPDAHPEQATETIMALPRGMPLLDLFIWTLWNLTSAVFSQLGVPGLHQFSTML